MVRSGGINEAVCYLTERWGGGGEEGGCGEGGGVEAASCPFSLHVQVSVYFCRFSLPPPPPHQVANVIVAGKEEEKGKSGRHVGGGGGGRGEEENFWSSSASTFLSFEYPSKNHIQE